MNNSQSSSMNGIESLPVDLIYKIFLNFPAKPIGQFRCVSKLWNSTLSKSDFTDLFLTKSSARPRLLFRFSLSDTCCLSSPQPQNPDENSSTALDSSIGLGFVAAPVAGLIFCPHYGSSNKILKSRIGNPTTDQYVDLPILTELNNPLVFFGYDPIGKQYKILCMSLDKGRLVARYHILTFPCEKSESWRSIQCPTRHRPFNYGICINGILYYVGRKEGASSYMIVCFDVRSEEFKFIDEPEAQALWSKRRGRYVCLTNFNGKLVSIRCHDIGPNPKGGRISTNLELSVWILEDDKKLEWSKRHVYHLTLPCDFYGRVVGMIGTGEIVLSPYNIFHPFYVFYFNPVRNTITKVQIQGIEVYKDHTVIIQKIEAFDWHTVTIYLDHVENVSFIA